MALVFAFQHQRSTERQKVNDSCYVSLLGSTVLTEELQLVSSHHSSHFMNVHEGNIKEPMYLSKAVLLLRGGLDFRENGS